MNIEKTSKLDYIPSHKTDGKYAILMETSADSEESWYYFIRVDNNEENLKFLKDQLESVEDWFLIDGLSIFYLEMDHFVSANTAKEMTKVDLNSESFHRKFDGTLAKIDFELENIKPKQPKKRKHKKNEESNDELNELKMCRIFEIIGNGQIENFIDDEDLDEEDLVTDDEEDTDCDADECEESDCDEDEDLSKSMSNMHFPNKKIYKIPPMLQRK